eukprot:gene1466-3429_t
MAQLKGCAEYSPTSLGVEGSGLLAACLDVGAAFVAAEDGFTHTILVELKGVGGARWAAWALSRAPHVRPIVRAGVATERADAGKSPSVVEASKYEAGRTDGSGEGSGESRLASGAASAGAAAGGSGEGEGERPAKRRRAGASAAAATAVEARQLQEGRDGGPAGGGRREGSSVEWAVWVLWEEEGKSGTEFIKATVHAISKTGKSVSAWSVVTT